MESSNPGLSDPQGSHERLLIAVIEGSPYAKVLMDGAGRIALVNAQAEILFGYRRDELLGQSIEMLVPERYQIGHPGLRNAYYHAPVARPMGAGRELFARRKDGTEVPVEIGLTPIETDGAMFTLAAITDITERKRAEELRLFHLGLQQHAVEVENLNRELESASRFKSQFVATMSHELRTPLNAIIGAAELLGRVVVEERARGHLETITEAADALLAIVNSILDFSKIEAGRMDIEKAPFSIEAVVEGAADVSAQLAREKGLVVQGYVDPSIPPVEGDAARLRQILLNLLGNAVKFTVRGQIVARAVPADIEGFKVVVRFEVEDTGRGIDPGALPLLFEPFVQVDKARTIAGTGLGLSISKRLVQLMGGEIGVFSTPEVGSKFWFTVPFDRASAPVGPIYRPLDDVRGLVVTKDDFFAQIIMRYLGSWGMESRVLTGPEDVAKATESTDGATCVMIVDADNVGTPETAEAVRRARVQTPSRVVAVGAGEAMRKPVRQSHLFDAVVKASGLEFDWGPGEIQPAGVAEADATVAVLVAEDNARLRRLLKLQFEELGIAAEFVSDGREAVEARRLRAYSVVFMDCQMPNMDGYEATRVIRGDDRAFSRGRTPIVAMTANAFAEDRDACLAAGMDDYLPKPVKLADLRSMVVRWAKGAPSP